MSALLAPLDSLDDAPARAGGRAGLRQVARVPMRASRAVFIAVLVSLLGLGMVGVLVLNTTIQQRSLQISTVQKQADDLGYQQAAKQAKVAQLSSSSALAAAAWKLGMRPDSDPVFIQLDANGKATIVKQSSSMTASSSNSISVGEYQDADQVTKAIEQARQAILAKKNAATAAASASASAQPTSSASASAQPSTAASATASSSPAQASASASASASTTGGR